MFFVCCLFCLVCVCCLLCVFVSRKPGQRKLGNKHEHDKRQSRKNCECSRNTLRPVAQTLYHIRPKLGASFRICFILEQLVQSPSIFGWEPIQFCIENSILMSESAIISAQGPQVRLESLPKPRTNRFMFGRRIGGHKLRKIRRN